MSERLPSWPWLPWLRSYVRCVKEGDDTTRAAMEEAMDPLLQRQHALNHAGTRSEWFEAGFLAGLDYARSDDANKRAELHRALGLAQAIAQARPYPPDMDGVRDVASEIVSLIESFLSHNRETPNEHYDMFGPRDVA